jgi:hypothetical protein
MENEGMGGMEGWRDGGGWKDGGWRDGGGGRMEGWRDGGRDGGTREGDEGRDEGWRNEGGGMKGEMRDGGTEGWRMEDYCGVGVGKKEKLTCAIVIGSSASKFWFKTPATISTCGRKASVPPGSRVWARVNARKQYNFQENSENSEIKVFWSDTGASDIFWMRAWSTCPVVFGTKTRSPGS